MQRVGRLRWQYRQQLQKDSIGEGGFAALIINADYQSNYLNCVNLKETKNAMLQDGTAARMVLRAPKALQPLVYMLNHLAMCWAATLTSVRRLSYFWGYLIKNNFDIFDCFDTLHEGLREVA